MNFLDLFTKIEFDDTYLTTGEHGKKYAKFPLDLLMNNPDGDILAVPLLDGVVTEDDAMRTVVCAAVDRNVIVHDEYSLPGELTLRLVALMKQVMRRNGGGCTVSLNCIKLTDLFIHEKVHSDKNTTIYGVKVHPVKTEVWENIIKFYADIEGTFLENRTEIVIGVDTEQSDCFIHTIRKSNGDEGLAILDNRKVILGVI
jgi:hypothetical protein